MSFIDTIKLKIAKSKIKATIVFAEGWNTTIQKGCTKLIQDGLITPILIYRNTKEVNPKIKCKYFVIDSDDLTVYANFLFELRKEKGLTLEQAQELIKHPNYLMAVLVKMDIADGGICGIEYTTKDTLRAALQVVKPKSKNSIVSSVMVMEKKDELMVFSDTSLIIDPNPQELASICENAVNFANNTLDIKNNNVALLSFSTSGSGAGASVDKVKQGYEIIKTMNLPKGTNVYGEIQFDAAYIDEIRSKKAPQVKWKQKANIYIFPNLDAGNIGYKLLQRCGKYNVTGPIIVGLSKQINDLSRGATLNEVITLGYITAFQAKA